LGHLACRDARRERDVSDDSPLLLKNVSAYLTGGLADEGRQVFAEDAADFGRILLASLEWHDFTSAWMRRSSLLSLPFQLRRTISYAVASFTADFVVRLGWIG